MKKSTSKITTIKQEFEESKRDMARGNISIIEYIAGNNVNILPVSRFR